MLSYNKGRHCRKLSYLLFPGLGEDWIRKELKKLDGEPCRAEIQISEDGAWPPPCLLLWGQRKWMESPRPQWTARAAHLCGNTARVPVHSSLCRSMQKQNDRRKKIPFSSSLAVSLRYLPLTKRIIKPAGKGEILSESQSSRVTKQSRER